MSIHFSSARHDWGTPWDFYATLLAEFDFTLDPCATPDNAKCLRFYTPDDDGLSQDWSGERVFVNPPYGREISKWIRKAATSNAEVVVCLLPARTDTKWFHEHIYNKENVEIRFLRGRLHFDGHENAAPFPSMVVVFRRGEAREAT